MRNSILLSLIFILLIGISSCNSEPEEVDYTVIKEKVNVDIAPFYNGENFAFNTLFESSQKNNLWFTKNKFYLSNVIALRDNGDRNLISEVVLMDYSLDLVALTISGDIAQGNYVAIEFDLGVREDYNMQDPATYPIEHPLSVAKNMYWGWATQYVFSKLEGFEVNGSDTVSFVIHTGTQDLYRPGVSVPINFTVATGGTNVSINYDLYTLLNQPDYTFDLASDGQSHTLDNLQLSIHYMDNSANAFY
ncbi:MAG: hypothetical protein ACI85Q_000922 [Salibacteraceae bacterium]|jgi:hypothetical protein